MESYSTVKVIGEGSFGRAVLVQTKNSKEKWVMKEIRLPQAQRREAALLASMKHPNIVAFKDSFEDNGHLYIVMEYCSGGDLLQRIRQQKGTLFSENVILRWFAQMCLGAQHIHDKRVLHRDLKSKNIFLTTHGTVKLGDFGSACILKSGEGYAHSYVGTPYYVSPEIWDSQPYNNKSDVWSLGCVLYELCTLRHPVRTFSTQGYSCRSGWSCRCDCCMWRSKCSSRCDLCHTYSVSSRLLASHSLSLTHTHTHTHSFSFTHSLSLSLSLSVSQFQANSWKSLILRVCRGAYTPIPSHFPYELHYLIKHMFKTNPRDRPSIHTILNSHRASRLLCKHLHVESRELVQEPVSQWRTEDAEQGTKHLGQKSLIATSTCEESQSISGNPRKKWEKGPSNTVLEALGNAEIISSVTMETAGGSDSRSEEGHGVTQGKRDRKRWERDPPERLWSLLEKVHLSMAFKTYTIDRADAGPLLGPLVTDQPDVPDCPAEIRTDCSRLEPRSDDEDTDFEEDCPADWIAELERMVT